MDSAIIAHLREAGNDPTLQRGMISIPIKADPSSGRIAPLDDDIFVMQNGVTDRVTPVHLRPMAELVTGDRRPPDFEHGPPDDYIPWFWMIEATAIDYCSISGIPERDDEFERLYTHLRRRPDGCDDHPLFSYLRAAMRLYASIREVSSHEAEAVTGRLARSARFFRSSYSSANYIRQISQVMRQQ